MYCMPAKDLGLEPVTAAEEEIPRLTTRGCLWHWVHQPQFLSSNLPGNNQIAVSERMPNKLSSSKKLDIDLAPKPWCLFLTRKYRTAKYKKEIWWGNAKKLICRYGIGGSWLEGLNAIRNSISIRRSKNIF